jgi:hypothetical protein
MNENPCAILDTADVAVQEWLEGEEPIKVRAGKLDEAHGEVSRPGLPQKRLVTNVSRASVGFRSSIACGDRPRRRVAS